MSERDAIGSSTLGSALWIVVAASLPVYRLLMTNVSTLIPYLVLALILVCVALGRVVVPVYAHLWLLALLMVPAAAIASGTTTSVIASSIVGVKLAIVIGISPFVLRYFVHTDPKFLRRVIIAFLAVQAVSAAAGLIQVTGVSILGRAANSGRANGLAVHPNSLGLMCTIALLVSIALISSGSTRVKVVLVGSALLNAAALLATGSLSSMLAFVVGVVVLLIALRITFRTLVISAAGSVVALLGLSAFGYNTTMLTGGVEQRVDDVTGASDGVASLDLREKTYSHAWQSISGDPLTGVGMDSTNEGTFDGKTVVHNYLLHVWYQGGLLLFILFVAITLAMVVLVFKSLRDANNGLAAATIAAMLTFAATSAFYDQQQYWLPIMVAVAAIAPKAANPASIVLKPQAPETKARTQHPLPTLHSAPDQALHPTPEESNA